MLLVTGASGNLGALVHAGLVEKGLAPLAGTRTPARFAALGRMLDFDDPATLDLSGVQTLLLISAGYGEDDVVIARHHRVISAAEQAGVRHVIYTSLTGAGDHLAFALAHRWTEQRLQRSSMTWTILRNGLYAELFGLLAAPIDGVITAPFGDGALAAVTRQDLADAAVAVAAAPQAHLNRCYELVGSVALTAAELAAALDVPYKPVALADQRRALAHANLLPFQPPMVMSMYSAVAAGFLGSVDGDLATLLARAPRPALPVAVAASQ
ncbi:NAD(P)-dependent oxidoreductase [Rhizocola hellebori]|uniref:NAD(P)-dependent oxidoreductase n=2 Tax=Rhizocola hellebori TaxID=1392758 RepID=A0A8J3Q940_9ACTN|nr:NAD(P)-dependent oxidoreductase [Rhizocola hellebori]